MIPVFFSVGPIHLYAFGVMLVSGVMLSLFLMNREIPGQKFFDQNAIYDMVFICVLAGLSGARLYYVAQHFSWYAAHPLDVFSVWEGGLIFYGGFIASIAALILFFRAKKIPVLEGFDFIIPYVALTQAFGRIGCFLNGCCFGSSCRLPWAVSFPDGPSGVHPTQLYEAAFCVVLFLALRHFYVRKKFPGQIFFLYFVFYGAGRFAIEFFREGNPGWLALTWNQWISLAVIAAGLILSFWNNRGDRPSF